MQDAIELTTNRKERPPIVRFERVAQEDKAESMKQGKYVAKDVDYALITAPYSKDVIKHKVVQWLAQKEVDAAGGRFPREWLEQIKESYRRWQAGQEAPVFGTPIKGWGVLSPAQQETLIRMNILTVEDLAGVNDEGIKRIGMGAVELKKKAAAWLATLNDRGPLTVKMAALETENEQFKATIASQQEQMQAMAARLEALEKPRVQVIQHPPETQQAIAAADILSDEPSGPVI